MGPSLFMSLSGYPSSTGTTMRRIPPSFIVSTASSKAGMTSPFPNVNLKKSLSFANEPPFACFPHAVHALAMHRLFAGSDGVIVRKACIYTSSSVCMLSKPAEFCGRTAAKETEADHLVAGFKRSAIIPYCVPIPIHCDLRSFACTLSLSFSEILILEPRLGPCVV